VRFPKPGSIDVPVYFLRIEVEILKGQAIWDDLVTRICNPPPRIAGLMRQAFAGKLAGCRINFCRSRHRMLPRLRRGRWL
jgi:hypothetical protein